MSCFTGIPQSKASAHLVPCPGPPHGQTCWVGVHWPQVQGKVLPAQERSIKDPSSSRLHHCQRGRKMHNSRTYVQAQHPHYQMPGAGEQSLPCRPRTHLGTEHRPRLLPLRSLRKLICMLRLPLPLCDHGHCRCPTPDICLEGNCH